MLALVVHDRTANAGQDGDKEIDVLAFYYEGLKVWVIFVNFFLGCVLGDLL